MDRKLLRTLLIIDRATGETERIHELDGNFHVSIADAASRAGLTRQQALEILEAGQDLTTAGFVRRLDRKAQGGLCQSGRHAWLDEEDRKRCCDPAYVRVQALTRKDLEEVGAENIVFRQLFRGWKKIAAEAIRDAVVPAEGR